MRYGVVLLNFKWAQKTLAATLTVINDCTHIQVLLDKSGAQIANCDYDSDQISSRVQSASALFLVNRTYVTSCCGSRRCEAEAHKQSFLECAFNEGCWHCGWWSSFRSVPVGTNVALCSTRERERERERESDFDDAIGAIGSNMHDRHWFERGTQLQRIYSRTNAQLLL